LVIVSATDGELATQVQRHHCGYVVEPGNSAGLADLLRRLSKARGEKRAMGQAARTMSEAHLSREKAFQKWRKVLDDVASVS
jgi:glycosyltransferase involved in cell wall biosynthesis